MSAPARQPGPPSLRRVVTNVVSNWGALVVNALIGFFLSPFVVHSLGNEAYGVWALLGSVVGYLGILDLGVRGAVTRYVANHHAAARHDEAGRILSAALLLFSVLGLTGVALAIGFALFGLPAFDLPPDLAGVARTVLVIGGVNLAVSLVSGVFGGAVVGVHRFDVVNALGVTIAIVRAVVVVLCLRAGGGLEALALIQLATSTASGVALALASRRVYPQLRMGLRRWRREHLRTLVSFGAASSLLQIAYMIMYHTDMVLIGAMLPVSAVTFFVIAVNLIDYARQLVGGISRTMTPLVGALDGADRLEQIQQAMLTGARLATLVLGPVLVAFVIRGETFIGLWMGPEYAAPSGAVLAVLAIARFPAAGYQVCTSTLMGLNRHRGLVPATLLEALANVALSYVLIGPLGITGVAIGTLLPRYVVTLVFGPWYVRRTTGLACARYYVEVIARPVAALVPFAIGCLAFEAWTTPQGILGFFIQVALTLPLVPLGAWPIALSVDERARAREALKRALGRWHRG